MGQAFTPLPSNEADVISCRTVRWSNLLRYQFEEYLLSCHGTAEVAGRPRCARTPRAPFSGGAAQGPWVSQSGSSRQAVQSGGRRGQTARDNRLRWMGNGCQPHPSFFKRKSRKGLRQCSAQSQQPSLQPSLPSSFRHALRACLPLVASVSAACLWTGAAQDSPSKSRTCLRGPCPPSRHCDCQSGRPGRRPGRCRRSSVSLPPRRRSG